MNTQRIRVLLVEHNEVDRMAFERAVSDGDVPYEYACLDSVERASAALREDSFDAVIVDYVLGDGTALDLLSRVPPTIPVIVVTGMGDEEVAVKAMRQGAADYLIKDNQGRYIKTIPVTVEHAIRSKQAELALKQSEEEFRLTFESAKDAIFWASPESGRITKCNRAAEQLLETHRDEIVGRPQAEIHPPEKRAYYEGLFRKHVDRMGAVDREAEVVTASGRIIPVEITSSVTTVGGRTIIQSFVRDVSDRIRMERELRQTHKMEALGTLAGGIAHDFNNILYAIIGFTELALDDAPDESLQHSNLLHVLEAANRAKDVTNQILAFSRQAELERQPMYIAPVIKDTLKFLRASVPSTIDIVQDIEEDPSMVLFDPTQMNQVLLNLCANASHAMRESGGTLTVTLGSFEVDSSLAAVHRDLIPGPYLKLTVKDTGHGMSSGVMERMFEPYFTTKQPGEGTGLGLAVVHGIVTRQGGSILCESEPGVGTVFDILLPVVSEQAREKKDVAAGVVSGSERILFVDDEQPIVGIAKQMLERLGYSVETRTSSVDALELFRHKPDSFDLVITDMTMPNMTGLELARQITSIRPNLPVILCTGFSQMVDKHGLSEFGILDIVSKPILKGEMARAVRQAIDGKCSTS